MQSTSSEERVTTRTRNGDGSFGSAFNSDCVNFRLAAPPPPASVILCLSVVGDDVGCKDVPLVVVVTDDVAVVVADVDVDVVGAVATRTLYPSTQQ